MDRTTRWQVGFALVMLLCALVFGAVAAFAFLFQNVADVLPFRQWRPMHVSAALFWIITGATAGVMHYKEEVFPARTPSVLRALYLILWITTILGVFLFYAFQRFGGREYWEFPPFLCAPLLVAWLLLMADYFRAWLRRAPDPPLYVWMWTTGIVFFLITFLEQNLWQVPWFRDHYLREVSVQWKSNGAMVGAWNQMIYGTALYLMTVISGDEGIARGRTAFLFWLLGLSNLMFNWGHHIYNVPTAGIRHVAYGISMTEWIFFIQIVRSFRAKLEEHRRHKHLLTYRFLIAAEGWVFLNLFLALFMSVPAINRYTHGTHITVAHAMGATIGINTMILLGSLGYMLRMDEASDRVKRAIARGRTIALVSLLVFWLALIIAGMLKGYRTTALGMDDFQRMMEPVMRVLHVFAFAGLGLLAGLGLIAWRYLGLLRTSDRSRVQMEPDADRTSPV
ncbi:MAG: cbb3-type cytochrome c oxidase subunit I, partial [Flavobacteriales bacterium]|nr:cbb3-type cytochrome c oxidase subunit I [Flavobacteriales bacterium]